MTKERPGACEVGTIYVKKQHPREEGTPLNVKKGAFKVENEQRNLGEEQRLREGRKQ